MSKILCEFASADLADLHLSHLSRQFPGIQGIVLRRRTGRRADQENKFFVPVFGVNPSGSMSAAQNHQGMMMPSVGLGVPLLGDMGTEEEPFQDQSVVAEFRCPDHEAQKITGLLHSMGAIRIQNRRGF